MRLIATFTEEKKALIFSLYLEEKNIVNHVEITKESNWSKETYGDLQCCVWVEEEEDLKQALKAFNLFKENPQDEQFLHLEALLDEKRREYKKNQETIDVSSTEDMKQERFNFSRVKKPWITFFFIALCSLLFLIDQAESAKLTAVKKPAYMPHMVFSSTLKKTLLYDYPRAFEGLELLLKHYGLKKMQTPDSLPEEGKNQMREIVRIRYWKGVSQLTQRIYRRPDLDWRYYGPMFEKIQQGQIWRLFTPALLHGSILHLLFNMMWLFVLGREIEQKLGILRYLTLILLLAFFSNTGEYLMSGANFLGISGVVSGFVGYIWSRQKLGEFYFIHPSTLRALMIFMLGVALLGSISFLLETVVGLHLFSLGIANTAHLSGLFMGVAIGNLRLKNR